MLIAADIFAPDDLGVYGLFVACSTFLLFVFGGDYYTFSNREVLHVSKKEIKLITKNQYFFYFMMYTILFPFSYIIVYLNYIPQRLFLVFYIVTILEHLNQESYRFLITFNKQTQATISLFLRTSLWPIIIIIIRYIFDQRLTLDDVFYLWLLSDIISFIYCTPKLFSLGLFAWTDSKINLKLIAHSLMIAFPFFVSTIAYKLIEYGNRFILAEVLTKKEVGAFTVIAGLSNSMSVIVSTTVVMYSHPKLLKYSRTDPFLFKKHAKYFFFENLIMSTIMFIGLLFLFQFLPIFIKNTLIINNKTTFVVLLCAIYVYNISLVPHYILYAKKNDLMLMIATILGMFVNLLFCIIFVPNLGMLGAALGSLLGYAAIIILKTLMCMHNKY
jgi:O-antigen/teichoic acid export membrane protein